PRLRSPSFVVLVARLLLRQGAGVPKEMLLLPDVQFQGVAVLADRHHARRREEKKCWGFVRVFGQGPKPRKRQEPQIIAALALPSEGDGSRTRNHRIDN